jgi:vacuolar-type H+-ATPase subunit D/Vma8
MPQVSKGALRFYKQRTARLAKAVPTLDLRRKQLTRELMVWEERLAQLRQKRDALAERMQVNPHPEIESLVSVGQVRMSWLGWPTSSP